MRRWSRLSWRLRRATQVHSNIAGEFSQSFWAIESEERACTETPPPLLLSGAELQVRLEMEREKRWRWRQRQRFRLWQW
jgi:hypothetical protein